MTKVSGIVNQFQTNGEPIEHKVVFQMILRCLTKKFAMVVTVIKEEKYRSISVHPRRVHWIPRIP